MVPKVFNFEYSEVVFQLGSFSIGGRLHLKNLKFCLGPLSLSLNLRKIWCLVTEKWMSKTYTAGRVGGRVTFQKIMPLCGPSCKLRLFRFPARLKFQDGPSVAIWGKSDQWSLRYSTFNILRSSSFEAFLILVWPPKLNFILRSSSIACRLRFKHF